jgi:hypothetical protein
MRFAVDAHAIGRHLTGNEVYVRSLLNAFADLDHSSEFVAYVSTDSAAQSIPSNILARRIAANPFLRLGLDLAMQVRRDRPDLLHVQYTAPIGCPVPVVVSVHDVSFLEHPEYFTRDRAWQLQWTVRRTVKRAAKILTAAAAVEERFSLGAPFILSVGDLQPRKNQIGLIRAFARLLKAYPQFKQDLVLAGKETWFADQVHRAARDSGVADRIRFFGFVSDRDLLQLYNACDLFVFPSFYEGFGLPALEAMACGRAVVCSHTSALPEVVDGAAILFDPYSTDQIVRAIADLLLDSELRQRMERLGLQRAAHFSWQKTARRTLEVFHVVLEKPRVSRAATASQTIVHR